MMSPCHLALAYWRANCSLVAAHVFGFSWPPASAAPIRTPRGHWGANPGIAWIVGHLSSHWRAVEPMQLIIGTGHASSFVFAHESLRKAWPPESITQAVLDYSNAGGVPSEHLSWPYGLAHFFGQLGSAIGVSQGLAAATQKFTCCVVGDGECELPLSIASILHSPVLFKNGVTPWLLAINANGHRMGGAARFSADELQRVLSSVGFQVVRSNEDGATASAAALSALKGAVDGRLTAWISETAKGWPAPEMLAGREFRGHLAHKPPHDPEFLNEYAPVLRAFLLKLSAGLFDTKGSPNPEVRVLALKSELGFSTQNQSRVKSSHSWVANSSWAPPIAAVDHTLAERQTLVFSPDEAGSNRLRKSFSTGLITEVLAEEVCFSWTIGHIAGRREAVYVTYEAFAPLIASHFAQYVKLIVSQEMSSRPPLAVIVTSLGWANSPTHQNSDFTATVMNRGSSKVRLICPLGASSASARLHNAFDATRGGAFTLVCSKYDLLDISDPGGPVVSLSLTANSEPEAYIIAVGDVCVTEATMAMHLAGDLGVSVQVLAIVEPTILTTLSRGALGFSDKPLVCVVWCDPNCLSGWLWHAFGRFFPVRGIKDRFAATPYETLQVNGIDRISILRCLFPESRFPEPQAPFDDEVIPHSPLRATPLVKTFPCGNLL